MFILKYWRYYCPYEKSFETLDECIAYARNDFESGEAYTECVQDEKGNEILNHEKLLEEMAY